MNDYHWAIGMSGKALDYSSTEKDVAHVQEKAPD